jgi:YVTN family beta-propeller protein
VGIDPRTDRLLGRYGPRGAARPHGLAIDPERRLLFVANKGNATLSVIDLATLRLRAELPVGSGPDVLAFDPDWDRLYVASESGVVSILTDLDGEPRFEGAVTMLHAHTVAVDPRTHLVYFPLQNVDGRPLLRIMSGTPPLPPDRSPGTDGQPALAANSSVNRR